MEDTLRQAVLCSGLSVNALARQVGMPQPVLHQFVHGQGITLRTAEKLVNFFGLELRVSGEGTNRSD
jgi:plasmid maintenance system antidote protein VapI